MSRRPPRGVPDKRSRYMRRGERGAERRRRFLLATALVATIATAVVWRTAHLWKEGLPVVAPPSVPAPRPVLEVYLAGVDLARHGRYAAALPLLRGALEQRGDLWQIHCDYAAALSNAVAEPGTLLGFPRPRTRSSWERVAMLREAFERLRSAEDLAETPHDRGYVLRLRAEVLRDWGLGWDAALAFQAARIADPASREASQEASDHSWLLHDPLAATR